MSLTKVTLGEFFLKEKIKETDEYINNLLPYTEEKDQDFRQANEEIVSINNCLYDKEKLQELITKWNNLHDQMYDILEEAYKTDYSLAKYFESKI